MISASAPPLGGAPRANIRRDTGSQLAFLPRVLRDVEDLLAGARGDAEALCSALLRDRLDEVGRSPFYGSLLAARSFAAGDFSSFDHLRAFPPIGREDVGRAMAALPASPPGDDWVAVKSSGTTGTPVSVLRDRYECLYMWTLLRFFGEQLRVAAPRRPRVVLLCSLPGGLEYSVRIPLFFGGALHRLSVRRERLVETLEALRPFAVFSDPAGLHWLAHSGARIAPELVLSSAQHLGAAQRASFLERYPTRLVNYYATIETGPIGWECLVEAGAFHVLEPHVRVEEEQGSVLVTRLRPGAFPLIRYRTGDRGEVRPGRCGCGFSGQSIQRFGGRDRSEFLRRDGGRVDAWQLAWIFKHFPVGAFRLSQLTLDRFELQLDSDAAPQVAEHVRGALQRLGFDEAAVELIRMAPSPTSKPEPFVSRIAAAGGGAAD